MPLDGLQSVKFGWLRGWRRYDHLVLVGFNKGERAFFMLSQRKINVFIKGLEGRILPETKPASSRSRQLFWSRDPHNYMEARFKYCGTLEISDTAKSFRHFVFITASGIEDEFKTAFGYQTLDLNDLESTTGHYHVPVVRQLVVEYEAGRLLV